MMRKRDSSSSILHPPLSFLLGAIWLPGCFNNIHEEDLN